MPALPKPVPSDARSSLLEGPPLGTLRALTLGEALHRAAEHASERTYIGLLDARNHPTEITFGQIHERAGAIARRLRALGIAAGDRVFLLLPTGEGFLEAFYGAILAGATAVPWPLPLTLGGVEPYVEGTVAGIARDAGPSLLVTTERAFDPLSAVARTLPGAPRCLTLDGLREAPASTEPLPDLDPDAVALLQYTSGRTRLPGGVRLTHRQLLSNVAGVGQALALSEDDVAVSWIPVVHDMGLVGVLFAGLYHAFPSYLMTPEAFLMRPYRWLQAISTFGATLSAAPNFAYRLCLRRVSDRHLEGMDLSRWRLALNGAEQVHPETCEAFAERFAPVGFRREAFYPLYGLAENALAATCPPLDETYVTRPFDETIARSALPAASPVPRTGALVASVGRPLPGQKVAIVDPSGTILPERHEGEIVVGGVCLMEGIHGRPERSAHLVRDGWLHTGDLGFVDAGRLYVTGRLKEMFIKMGRNYYPDDVEEAIEASGALEGRRVTALAVANPASGTEDLLVVVEGPIPEGDERKGLEQALHAALLDALGIRADRLWLREAGTLGEAGASAPERRAAARALHAAEAEGAA